MVRISLQAIPPFLPTFFYKSKALWFEFRYKQFLLFSQVRNANHWAVGLGLNYVNYRRDMLEIMLKPLFIRPLLYVIEYHNGPSF